MNKIIPFMVFAAVLALVARWFGWTDPFHFACGGLSLLLLGAAWLAFNLRRRSAEVEEDGETENGLDGALIETSPVRSSFLGGLMAVLVCLCLWGTFSVMKSVPAIYGMFYDADRERMEQQCATLEAHGNFAQAADLIEKRLQRQMTFQWQTNLARRWYDNLVQAAKVATAPKQRLTILERAANAAKLYRLDGQLAQALAEQARHNQALLDQVEHYRAAKAWPELTRLIEVALNQRPTEDQASFFAERLHEAWIERGRNAATTPEKVDCFRRAQEVAARNRLQSTLADTLLGTAQSGARDWDRFVARVSALRGQDRWDELVTLIRLKMEDQAEAPADAQMAQLLVDTLLGWGDGLPDLSHKADKYRQALAAANKQGLEVEVIADRLRTVETELARRSNLLAKIDELRKKAAWSELVALTDLSIREPRSQWPCALPAVLYDALIQWGDALASPEEKRQRFDWAQAVARSHGLDPDSAVSRLQAVNVELAEAEKRRRPAALPKGCRIELVRTFTDSFPPSLRFDVSVADARGEPLRHLEEKDFRVTCQGNPVKAIELARVQNQTPLQNIVLLLDTSESVRGDALEAAKSGAKHLLLSLQGEPGVSVQVLAFNDKVARVCDWTGDTLHAASRLDGLHATGRTALFHAIEAACDSSRGRSGVRKLILFTDGRNTIRSLANLEQLIKRLKQAQVEVFIIGLKTHELDVETLRRLADGTDGVYLEAPDAARLVETFQAASSLIRRFVYRLIVTPGNSPVGDVLALEIRVGGENAITLSQNVKVQSAVSSLGR